MTSCDLCGDSRMIADAVIVVYGYLEVPGTPHTLQTRSGAPAAWPALPRARCPLASHRFPSPQRYIPKIPVSTDPEHALVDCSQVAIIMHSIIITVEERDKVMGWPAA